MLATFAGASPPLSPAHAAFVAGYAVHLIWDEIWAWDVFVPYYRDNAQWPERKSFFVHHNALRVWLDRQAHARLLAWPDLTSCLGDVDPNDWLPFAPDWALCRWRDWLVVQLLDPAAVQTAEVFAERLQVPVAELEALVAEMEVGSYGVVPHLFEALWDYEATALAESVHLLSGPLVCAQPVSMCSPRDVISCELT